MQGFNPKETPASRYGSDSEIYGDRAPKIEFTRASLNGLVAERLTKSHGRVPPPACSAPVNDSKFAVNKENYPVDTNTYTLECTGTFVSTPSPSQPQPSVETV